MFRAKERRARRSPSRAGPRTHLAVGVIFGGLATFAAIAALVHRKQVEAIDKAFTMRLQAIRDPWFERAMVAASWPGFPPQSRILPPTYAAVLWIARFRLEAVFQLAAWGAPLLSTIVKAFLRRPRPVAGKDIRVVSATLDGSSLPSGHVLSYVAIYGWMTMMVNQTIRPLLLRRVIVAALATLIAAVGPSRIYLGHHWPTDVAASYVLGSSYLAALLVAYRHLRSRRVLERPLNIPTGASGGSGWCGTPCPDARAVSRRIMRPARCCSTSSIVTAWATS